MCGPSQRCTATVPPCGRLSAQPSRTMRNYPDPKAGENLRMRLLHGECRYPKSFPLLSVSQINLQHQLQNMQSTGEYLLVVHPVNLLCASEMVNCLNPCSSIAAIVAIFLFLQLCATKKWEHRSCCNRVILQASPL